MVVFNQKVPSICIFTKCFVVNENLEFKSSVLIIISTLTIETVALVKVAVKMKRMIILSKKTGF